ncbi:ABC transporter substrate-binding protein [Streptomyces sp. NRRL S-118]|uniref:ABC transporter substrate-binding protein n=1 Tax=Streptomyces sp. NRRL S-118 TaxID=1463881 RepID=UPI0004C5BD00|nr:ABC transporter substrate-binding protein [Streptomyces sp. NRRL S-118]
MPTDALALALDAVPLGDDLRRPVDYNARLVAEAVLATPYREAPGTAVPLPHTAYGLEPVDDGLRWRMWPAEGPRWSDGTPLRAEHLVAGVRDAAARDRQTGRFFADGDAAAAELPDGRVEIRLREPAGFLPPLLTLPQFSPLRPGSDAVLGPYAPAPAGPDGGPRLRLHRYAGADGLPDELAFPVLADLDAAVGAFRAGLVHATPTTSFDVPDTGRYAHDPDLVTAPMALFASLEFGRRVPALRRAPGLRAAVAAALDPEALAAGTGGLLEAAPAPVAALLGRDAPPRPAAPGAREVRAVRAACAGAGPLEVAYADFVPNGTVVEAVCARLRQVFGLDLRPRALPYPAYVRAALTGDHTLLYTLTTADFPHPAALLGPWASGGTYSRTTGFTDAPFDRLFDAARTTTGTAETAAWLAAEERWLYVMPRVPLLRVRAHYLASPRVRAAGLTPSGVVPPLGLGARATAANP